MSLNAAGPGSAASGGQSGVTYRRLTMAGYLLEFVLTEPKRVWSALLV